MEETEAFILFFQKRKIFQVIVLGEMDRAESSYEAMCFVTELEKEEFISSDAMSKLRQVSFLNDTLKQLLCFNENKPCTVRHCFVILFLEGGSLYWKKLYAELCQILQLKFPLSHTPSLISVLSNP